MGDLEDQVTFMGEGLLEPTYPCEEVPGSSIVCLGTAQFLTFVTGFLNKISFRMKSTLVENKCLFRNIWIL